MKRKATRLLAFFLCLLMLVSTMAIPVFAQANESGSSSSGSTSSSNKTSMSDVSAILNALSYDDYMENVLSKYANKDFGEGHEIKVDILNGVFVVGDTTTKLEEFYKDETKCDEPSKDGKNDGVLIGPEGTATWTFVVPEEYSGNYTIEIVYCQADDHIIDKSQADEEDKSGTSNAIERIFYLNGSFPFAEARTLVLNKVWKYNYKVEDGKNSFENESEDGKGDDIRPSVYKDPSWVTYTISDSNGYYVNPFEFYFKPGENSISLEGQREDVIIQSITLRPYESPISYKEYIANMQELHGKVSENRPSTKPDKQEAEEPTNVSAITLYPVYDRTSSITSGLTGKQSASQVKYNTAGKEQWQNVGEWMSYEIEVPESGYYSIAVRYKQALLSGMYVSRKVYIDGELPFAEAANCRFPYSNSWETCYLNDGTTEFEFYLEKGTHEIKLEATLGEMGEQIKKVSESLSNINNCYLEIIKLTGTNPDTNRSYGFTRVMPDVLKVMLLEAQNLESVYNYLVAVNKAQDGGTGEGEKTSTIKQVYQLLEKMATNEGEIPGNLATLKSQIGSLGTWINSAKTQPLQVDYYQLQSIEEELPKADSNFIQALWFEIKLFFASFIGNNYDEQKTTAENVDEVIEVWVVTGRDQAQIIRNLIENDFTPNTNIGVNIKLIAGGTLLPSIIAGVGPEVSLMEASTTIIDYALRNAIKPLNSYINEDIATYDPASGKDNILEVFPDASFEPLTLYNFGYGDDYEWAEEDLYLWRDGENYAIDAEGADGKTNQKYGYGWQQKDEDGNVKRSGIELYALPDSLTFSMMFYRKDVLTSLEIELPDTWDDMLSILPILQYNNMEIGIQNDAYTFMYQNGNEAYSNNGMTINFDSKGVLNSFEQMCNYYTQYSLPYTYDFANRFRTGEMPIGIAAYTTCNQLSVFASELSGLWTFVRLPGQVVLDENGETVYEEDGVTPQINRNAMATVTGCVMIDNGDSEDQQKKDKAAWEFMRWYTGSEFQADYSNEIVSILGIAARPATANQLALEDLPWTAEEKNNILEQFANLEAVPNHPGAYYLARYVNFAFLAAYNEGEDASDALLSYVSTINSELTRRRKEFGMLTYDDYMKLNPNGELTSPTVGE
ncbi:MAG: extracellular solute-binding protein [Clostridia bacterium]|nr:extracellular solute-binding protein [Clostridia bacterium]